MTVLLHPVFQKFTPFEGESDGRFQIDFLGSRTDPKVYRTIAPTPAGHYRADYPRSHPMHYEYVSVLSAVLDAEDKFVMAELGAAWGPWLVRAALGLRKLGKNIPFHLIGVEGNARHYGWLKEHFQNNDLDPDAHTLIHGVVSDKEGDLLFIEHKDDDAGSYIPDDQQAHQRDPQARVVKSYSLQTLLAEHDRVDLIHMDVQGAELKIVRSGLDVLTEKVRMLCIGTHSVEIDQELPRLLLPGDKWLPRNLFGRDSTFATLWGIFPFRDGCQIWMNKRFL